MNAIKRIITDSRHGYHAELLHPEDEQIQIRVYQDKKFNHWAAPKVWQSATLNWNSFRKAPAEDGLRFRELLDEALILADELNKRIGTK